MNADLEQTLDELGPEYRAVVARLRAGREAEEISRPVFRLHPVLRLRSKVLRPTLVAASLLALVGLGVYCLRTPAEPNYGAREYRLPASELIARQNPDGSWQNDFLTRRNAETLRTCTDAASRIAYKKAMRNLRLRGVL